MSTLGDILKVEKDAAKAAIVGLPIQEINVEIKKFAWRRGDITVPCIILAPTAEQLPNLGTNASDDTGYRTQVSVVRASNQDNTLTVDDDTMLEARERLIAAFREKRLESIPGCFRVNVEPGPVFDAAAFAAGYDATTIYLVAWVRAARH